MSETPEQFDLFGRPIVASNGNRQMPLFHEPARFEPAKPAGVDARIARKFANTKTGDLYAAQSDNG